MTRVDPQKRPGLAVRGVDADLVAVHGVDADLVALSSSTMVRLRFAGRALPVPVRPVQDAVSTNRMFFCGPLPSSEPI